MKEKDHLKQESGSNEIYKNALSNQNQQLIKITNILSFSNK